MASKDKFSADWAHGLTPEQKLEIQGTLKSTPFLRQTLLSILDRYENEESRAETSLSEYDSASWAYKQADRNGARRVIRKVRSLFTID